VWVEHEQSQKLDQLVEKVLQEEILRDNPQFREAFVAKLTERVLGSSIGENVTPMRGTAQKRGGKEEAG